MILSGKEIQKRLSGDILINPFNCNKVNPNSYNVTLHNELMVYDCHTLDMKWGAPVRKIEIPSEGFMMMPDELYLGRTEEYTETHNLVPMLEGRSSVGRLGVFIHVTAGFGDVGFKGYWTLELHCIKPIKIYPFVEIGQLYYHTIEGDYDTYDKKGKYQGNNGIQPSFMYKELND
jgi:dCTP deaminase